MSSSYDLPAPKAHCPTCHRGGIRADCPNCQRCLLEHLPPDLDRRADGISRWACPHCGCRIAEVWCPSGHRRWLFPYALYPEEQWQGYVESHPSWRKVFVSPAWEPRALPVDVSKRADVPGLSEEEAARINGYLWHAMAVPIRRDVQGPHYLGHDRALELDLHNMPEAALESLEAAFKKEFDHPFWDHAWRLEAYLRKLAERLPKV